MASLIDRHRDQIVGVLSCYDRVVIRGTLPSICHAKAMETTLDARGIRLIRRLGNARAQIGHDCSFHGESLLRGDRVFISTDTDAK